MFGNVLIVSCAVVPGIRYNVHSGCLGQLAEQPRVSSQILRRALDQRGAPGGFEPFEMGANGFKYRLPIVAAGTHLFHPDEIDQDVLVGQGPPKRS